MLRVELEPAGGTANGVDVGGGSMGATVDGVEGAVDAVTSDDVTGADELAGAGTVVSTTGGIVELAAPTNGPVIS
jgi:hypothetical protein